MNSYKNKRITSEKPARNPHGLILPFEALNLFLSEMFVSLGHFTSRPKARNPEVTRMSKFLFGDVSIMTVSLSLSFSSPSFCPAVLHRPGVRSQVLHAVLGRLPNHQNHRGGNGTGTGHAFLFSFFFTFFSMQPQCISDATH